MIDQQVLEKIIQAVTDKEVLKGTIQGILQAIGTIVAALIVGIAGSLISRRYARQRDKQDKESQWRQHAIELTKLDLQRKLESWPPERLKSIRPSVLDFLANYRDLQELDKRTPGDLYETIEMRRISRPNDANPSQVNSITTPEREQAAEIAQKVKASQIDLDRKLSIADAARAISVARGELKHYIRAGRIRKNSDGTIDLGELRRAGFIIRN
jgi:hypothetical protein